MGRTLISRGTMAGLVLLAAVTGAEEHLKRTISVSGEGEATASPDMATIHTGVVTQAGTARDALDANSAAMDGVMDALRAHRIAARDIQTLNFEVRPEYKRGPRTQHPPETAGYRVTNQVRVHLRSLPDLGQVLDALVAAGSNQISGINLGIEDPVPLLNQARTRAISEARSRAELYASAAGVRVGEVISISETQGPGPRPQFVARSFAAEADAAVPIATGEQQLRARVHMVFSLEDPE